MSSLDDKASEIPSFVKKYIPGVMRGLSWAKYSDEKNKGTAMKSDALQDAYRMPGFDSRACHLLHPPGPLVQLHH